MATKKQTKKTVEVQDDALLSTQKGVEQQPDETMDAESSVKEEEKAPEQKSETTEKQADTSPKEKTIEEQYAELITAEYAKGYPDNKEWHVTTDRSVFLSGDLQHAKNHQKTLRGGGEVITIKTK